MLLKECFVLAYYHRIKLFVVKVFFEQLLIYTSDITHIRLMSFSNAKN